MIADRAEAPSHDRLWVVDSGWASPRIVPQIGERPLLVDEEQLVKYRLHRGKQRLIEGLDLTWVTLIEGARLYLSDPTARIRA